jgi:hypothetical protein
MSRQAETCVDCRNKGFLRLSENGTRVTCLRRNRCTWGTHADLFSVPCGSLVSKGHCENQEVCSVLQAAPRHAISSLKPIRCMFILVGMQNGAFDPCLAAIHRTLFPAMSVEGCTRWEVRAGAGESRHFVPGSKLELWCAVRPSARRRWRWTVCCCRRRSA